jgi:imidazolonepropionase
MMNNPVLTGPFSQILTMEDLPVKGPITNESMTIINDGGLMTDGGLIVGIGDYNELKRAYPSVKRLEMDGPQVLLPGLIDAHTHLCFAGSRALDYEARNSGKTYLEIAESGGGIWHTVTKTRQASLEDLTTHTIERLERLIHNGITTVEIKSGYGLSKDQEIKMLRSINIAGLNHAMDIIPTCLAAHICPKDFGKSPAEYLSYLLQELVPVVRQEGLCDRFDIFIEKSAFDPGEAQDFLHKISNQGFSITVHGDQFSTGGSEVAVAVGAVSVDHLEASGQKEIHLLANSNTACVVLPGASIGLGEPFAPARQLLDAGCSVVIASDWNPGSAPQGNLLAQAAILGSYEKISAAEIFAALTCRAARVLQLKNTGTLSLHSVADAVSFPCKRYEEILYHQGELKPQHVWKNGQLIF